MKPGFEINHENNVFGTRKPTFVFVYNYHQINKIYNVISSFERTNFELKKIMREHKIVGVWRVKCK